MLRINDYEVRPYKVYSTDYDDTSTWYDIIRNERVVRRVRTIEEAISIVG
jgi:hypothetical protein